MTGLSFFIVFSVIWGVLEHYFTGPIGKFYQEQGWFKPSETAEGMAGVTIAVVLGLVAGSYYGPIVAFSISRRGWSWVAVVALILSSSIAAG